MKNYQPHFRYEGLNIYFLNHVCCEDFPISRFSTCFSTMFLTSHIHINRTLYSEKLCHRRFNRRRNCLALLQEGNFSLKTFEQVVFCLSTAQIRTPLRSECLIRLPIPRTFSHIYVESTVISQLVSSLLSYTLLQFINITQQIHNVKRPKQIAI